MLAQKRAHSSSLSSCITAIDHPPPPYHLPLFTRSPLMMPALCPMHGLAHLPPPSLMHPQAHASPHHLPKFIAPLTLTLFAPHHPVLCIPHRLPHPHFIQTLSTKHCQACTARTLTLSSPHLLCTRLLCAPHLLFQALMPPALVPTHPCLPWGRVPAAPPPSRLKPVAAYTLAIALLCLQQYVCNNMQMCTLPQQGAQSGNAGQLQQATSSLVSAAAPRLLRGGPCLPGAAALEGSGPPPPAPAPPPARRRRPGGGGDESGRQVWSELDIERSRRSGAQQCRAAADGSSAPGSGPGPPPVRVFVHLSQAWVVARWLQAVGGPSLEPLARHGIIPPTPLFF